MDYTYFKKDCFERPEELSCLDTYDCLIAAYVNCERVIKPIENIPCKELWWVCDAGQDALPPDLGGSRVFHISDESDDGICQALLDSGYVRIGVDITGFAIPHMLVLFRYLHIKGFKLIDFFYTEPNKYKDNEHTQFSDGFSIVKQVFGYRGLHIPDTDKDLLVIAAGYDHSRINDVAFAKKSAKKVLMFGFPPSSPGMFQENILSAHKAETAVGEDCFINMELNIFASANDPFSSAQALKEYLENNRNSGFTNVYFSPLSTKPIALGMALFYILEKGMSQAWSILYPYCDKYLHDTSSRIAHIWRYQFEL